MKKILSLSLTLIMVISLVGCNSNTTTTSELWEMPEPPYPLKLVYYKEPEVKEFYVGSEEYEIGDSSIRTVLGWSSALELKEVSFYHFNKAMILQKILVFPTDLWYTNKKRR